MSDKHPGRRAGARRAGPPAPDGLVIVDKPAGHTSHDVVARLRGMARTRRVGHAGTLDPMATGVLVLGTGRATRLLGHLALTEKEYTATIRLGQTTVTDDAEGEITASAGIAGVPGGAEGARKAVEAGTARLTGAIQQVPSKVSAIKVDGKRSYKRAREGEDFELDARPVTVSSFVVHEVREAVAGDGTAVLDADATVVCSSGTYVRALARDLGAGLGTGGHLTALRRTRVGPYGLGAAHTLEQLQTAVDAEPDGTSGLPVMPIGEAAAAAFPRWDVDEKLARLLANGVRPAAPGFGTDGPVAVFGPDDRFLALVREEAGKAKSLAVFV
ncbi:MULTISPECIES: tRNA pseudouridine(55) synthase TruB [unclassified Streptomyces]|uniref:tRNA pseudouridine(55) synthase TruB n=1 Tax=unclassified Streptomyces TaxID=2593676 RepID=UPI000BF7DC73|nr:tRNA pseudouridine(55) synthase TruB [Streptomyces sp. Ru87]PGH52483.1 tRNA pseudouridine(55) synthase TruB [Streptomyces sp. Ru87]